jgi:dTDP-4-dehydrorhamnose 3,5-epimerase-like enzyme
MKKGDQICVLQYSLIALSYRLSFPPQLPIATLWLPLLPPSMTRRSLKPQKQELRLLEHSPDRGKLVYMISSSWKSLRPQARKKLEQRDYSPVPLVERIRSEGVAAGELVRMTADDPIRRQIWIPGLEIFPIKVYRQRHRGTFAELTRETEGALSKIGIRLRQWSVASMFAGTAKGFHIHPAYIPEGRQPEEWLKYLYESNPASPLERPYDREQWDVMYLLNGVAEFALIDERAGFPRRIMRLYVDGYARQSADNVGLVIPPGVAHAVRVESSHDIFIVYGTTTVFDPKNEGRIASRIELPLLPNDWEQYLQESLE